MRRTRHVIAMTFIFTSILVVGQTPPPAKHLSREAPLTDPLRSGFLNPPQAAKLRCYWWWMNGYTTVDTITQELTAMKAKGYAGVLLVDDNTSTATEKAPAGPDYGSPEWMVLYLHALKVAAGLGLEVSLEITSGGNVGALGGPGVGPDDALKMLTYSSIRLSGPSTREIVLPVPHAEGGYYRPIAVLAYPLQHGSPFAGDAGSHRQAIRVLPLKLATKEAGIYSMPDEDKVLLDAPSVEGEQDTNHAEVIDLSARTDADGRLHWNVPAGDWEVLRIGYTASAERVSNRFGSGYVVDALSAAAFDHYWDRVISPILHASKPYLRKSLRYVVTDSWEAGGANWTADFRKEFIARRGYDPVPYLPVVSGRIVDSRDSSNQFLADLRRTVADLITVNYYDHFANRAAAFGLGTHPESGGPHGAPIDGLETFRSSAFPQAEFWAASPLHRTTDEDRFFVKEAASAAHIYGKQYVAAESFSTINHPWSNSPGTNLKPAFDHAITEGLNRVIWHEFTSSPESYGKPGIEYFADTHLDPNVTWWNQAGSVLLALNRAQFLMQQGTPVADLLYYYGTQVPDFVRLKSDDPASVLPGYEYDVTNQDALLNRMIAANGQLRTPEGIHYQALALPADRAIAVADLRWIESYVRQGGVVIGLKPIQPLSIIPSSQLAEYKRTAASMWGNCDEAVDEGLVHYGNGRIYCTRNAHHVFASLHLLPDFSYSSTDRGAAFDYVHRRTDQADIYFVRNMNNSSAKATMSFRVHGRAPELWQVDTGESAPVLIYREKGDQTEIPLSIPAFGSVFVVFEKPSTTHLIALHHDGASVFPSMEPGTGVYGSARSELNLSEPGTYVEDLSNGSHLTMQVAASAPIPSLAQTWTLSFPPDWGAPASISMPTLESWTASSIPGVRYFSGTATYTNMIDVPPGLLNTHHEVWMNLGDVREVATVAVNGTDLRTLWHGPFTLRIDHALHQGKNAISIRVTNLWPNRLIGDKQPTSTVHYTHTNIDAYDKDSPLLPSGLLTPVTFLITDTARMD